MTPLSEFVGDDPLQAGVEPAWHDAADGVATLDAVLAALPERRSEIGEPEEVSRDCHEWRDRLAAAAERRIPFLVILRVGDGISGHEMSVRRGHF